MINTTVKIKKKVNVSVSINKNIAGSALPAIVKNSDDSFDQSIPGGQTLVLNDNQFDIYFNGVLKASILTPSQVNETLNINL